MFLGNPLVKVNLSPSCERALQPVFISNASKSARSRDDSSENEIRSKHKRKQNHLNLFTGGSRIFLRRGAPLKNDVTDR